MDKIKDDKESIKEQIHGQNFQEEEDLDKV
jgi:hypothetical protein